MSSQSSFLGEYRWTEIAFLLLLATMVLLMRNQFNAGEKNFGAHIADEHFARSVLQRSMIAQLLGRAKSLVAVAAHAVGLRHRVNLRLRNLMRVPQVLIENLPLRVAFAAILTAEVESPFVLLLVLHHETPVGELLSASFHLARVGRILQMLQRHVLLQVFHIRQHLQADLALDSRWSVCTFSLRGTLRS